VLAVGLAAGCREREADPDTFQGVVEYEERDLGFEVTGRITELAVHEGDPLAPQGLIARLAPELERSALAARESEARAAPEQLDLLRAGSRPEDVRGLARRFDAARAAEALVARHGRADAQAGRGAGGHASRAGPGGDPAPARRGGLARRRGALRAARRGARVQEVGAARDRLAAAQASSDMQRERVSRYELRALEASEVLEVHLRTGELAVPGLPVVTVADTGHPYADVFVPEAAVGGIAVGARARARIDALAHDLPGHVERISRRTEFTPRYLFSPAERASLVVRVRVRLDDPKRELHAGVPAFVHVERGQSGKQAAP
jgi:multidrug resistance efflux pump